MGVFDDILDDLKVPVADRDLPVKDFAAKYPEIHDRVIQRKVYSQKLDEMDREKATRTKDFEELAQWRNVTRENWDPTANDGKGDWKQHVELRTQLTASEQRAKDLEALVEQGGEMNFDQVLSGLKEKGVVLKTDIADVVRKGDYEADVNKRFNNWGVSTEIMLAKTAPLVTRYAREFPGEDMDVTAFLQQSTTEDWKDTGKAYERFTAGKRQELEVARLKKDAEDAEKRGYDKAKAEKQAIHQPDDTSGGGPQVVGALQERLAREKAARTGETTTGPGKLGDGSAAAEGLRKLREGTLVAP